ncbi:cache domain-containing protein [Geobacter pelophilus]|uniref:Cache domain-containing protein n=1 Tax=Geoanaerobacter pelophilus TaxID=60036 RepID=A0AAW4L6Y2_9BACT|nr:cache domain-containing protein [Geoanaerobacter pelophilus]MBT0665270.1 cache domain-containing protein [Geoanaerobacter pelophilus]
MKLTTKFILINVIIVTMAIAITTCFVFVSVHKEIDRQASKSQESILKSFWELLRTKGSDFSVTNGKLMAGNYVINGNYELPDKITEIFGGTATIFMGDTRVSTNVLKADGGRAIDTKLVGPAYDSVIKEGKPYRGEAIILDIPYFTAYDPIKNKKGETIGVLYVGVKKSDYFAAYNHLQWVVIVTTAVITIIFSFLVGFLVKKSLFPIIGKVSGISEKIHSHAGDIASTMDQQADFATQLASSVIEISSTMEEFSSTASQIAQHSQSVVERADKTLDDSKTGAAEVENLTFKINDISQNIQANLSEIVELGRRSKEINKVMEIINNIANQTKLIAFNAALEAASAGEAGKRFGVVAVEIRRLADSVVESTKEIEGKITEILDSVNRLVMSSEKSFELIQEGQEYASHTVMMLIESVDGVEETANAARHISLSTQQQQVASSQVVMALKDIEKGVRFSTDSTHQSSVVTGQLASLAEELRSLVMFLKAGDKVADSELKSTRETN